MRPRLFEFLFSIFFFSFSPVLSGTGCPIHNTKYGVHKYISKNQEKKAR